MWPATLLKICLLRANPQDLPTSTGLTALALAAYYLADVATALMTVPLARALEAAAADTFVLVALVHAALNLRRLGARTRQTLTALAGGGALLAGVTVIIESLLPEGVSSVYVWAPSLLWLLAVYGHVLRHAFDVPYALGIVATGAYLILSLFITAPFLISPDAI